MLMIRSEAAARALRALPVMRVIALRAFMRDSVVVYTRHATFLCHAFETPEYSMVFRHGTGHGNDPEG